MKPFKINIKQKPAGESSGAAPSGSEAGPRRASEDSEPTHHAAPPAGPGATPAPAAVAAATPGSAAPGSGHRRLKPPPNPAAATPQNKPVLNIKLKTTPRPDGTPAATPALEARSAASLPRPQAAPSSSSKPLGRIRLKMAGASPAGHATPGPGGLPPSGSSAPGTAPRIMIKQSSSKRERPPPTPADASPGLAVAAHRSGASDLGMHRGLSSELGPERKRQRVERPPGGARNAAAAAANAARRAGRGGGRGSARAASLHAQHRPVTTKRVVSAALDAPGSPVLGDAGGSGDVPTGAELARAFGASVDADVLVGHDEAPVPQPRPAARSAGGGAAAAAAAPRGARGPKASRPQPQIDTAAMEAANKAADEAIAAALAAPPPEDRGPEVKFTQAAVTRLLDSLNKKDRQFIFAKPVLPAQAPGYQQIIKKPMDLSTIRNKVNKGQYAGWLDLKADLARMVQNALVYNQAGQPVHTYTLNFEPVMWEVFNKARYARNPNKRPAPGIGEPGLGEAEAPLGPRVTRNARAAAALTTGTSGGRGRGRGRRGGRGGMGEGGSSRRGRPAGAPYKASISGAAAEDRAISYRPLLARMKPLKPQFEKQGLELRGAGRVTTAEGVELKGLKPKFAIVGGASLPSLPPSYYLQSITRFAAGAGPKVQSLMLGLLKDRLVNLVPETHPGPPKAAAPAAAPVAAPAGPAAGVAAQAAPLPAASAGYAVAGGAGVSAPMIAQLPGARPAVAMAAAAPRNVGAMGAAAAQYAVAPQQQVLAAGGFAQMTPAAYAAVQQQQQQQQLRPAGGMVYMPGFAGPQGQGVMPQFQLQAQLQAQQYLAAQQRQMGAGAPQGYLTPQQLQQQQQLAMQQQQQQQRMY